jgi:hypothetical protein
MTCINVIYRILSAGLGDALRLAETNGLSWTVDEKTPKHLAGEEHRLQDRPLRGCHSPVDPDRGPTAGNPKSQIYAEPGIVFLCDSRTRREAFTARAPSCLSSANCPEEEHGRIAVRCTAEKLKVFRRTKC